MTSCTEAEKLPRIGIYGGSFDPIHYGHMVVAEAALSEMALDSLLFIPTVVPPHKTSRTPYSHRLAMLRAALDESQEGRFLLSTIEEELPTPSYTVKTIEALLARRQAAYYFVLGVDAFLDIMTWEGFWQILSLVNMVISPRKGYAATQLEELMKSLGYTATNSGWCHPVAKKIFLLKTVPPLVSSSDIKIALQNGIDSEEKGALLRLLSPEVMRYIRKNNLYRG